MVPDGLLRACRPRQAQRNYLKAASKGVLKVMSKMGISTVASYTGAQVFEAIGLDRGLARRLLRRHAEPLGGIGLDELAEEVARRHRYAYQEPRRRAGAARDRGRRRVPVAPRGRVPPVQPPDRVQAAARHPGQALRRSSRSTRSLVNEQSERLGDASRPAARCAPGRARRPVPIDEVEPAEAIMRRFATGAMSYGSISAEAHETLAIAMNRLGAGRTPARAARTRSASRPTRNGDLRRSAVKQVASGRFGVTSEYLVNADDIQIKIAQGAKPGEGGQLPGHKVYPWIAKTRYSTPGRRADLAAAPSRHLLDRGPRPAHLRPEERQPPRPGARQAGRRGRRRHGGGRGGQGPRRRRAHLRPRRRAPAPPR